MAIVGCFERNRKLFSLGGVLRQKSKLLRYFAVIAAMICSGYGCDSDPESDDSCLCRHEFDHGSIELACGESVCLDGVGYECVDHNEISEAPEACEPPVLCGNGNIDPGESCDGNCPASCDDGLACTSDLTTGSAENCDLVCTNSPIEECVDGDGCCAPECNNTTDNDCSSTCGNGTIEQGEVCDGNCPTSCDDGVACTEDSLVGSAESCSASCRTVAITSCVSGDECCPKDCDSTNDDDCSPLCGNGELDPGETCDGDCPTSCDDDVPCTRDSLVGSAETCSASCSSIPITSCTDDDECCAPGCYTGNDNDCSPTCGNGHIEEGETCDGDCPTSCDDEEPCTTDILSGSPKTCSSTCSTVAVTECRDDDECCPAGCNANIDNDCEPLCDNGVLESGETCDGDCPTSCDDGEICTEDILTGSPETCDVECSVEPIITCEEGDECCPEGCSVDEDSDCLETCGTEAVLCGARGYECGSISVTDLCGFSRTLNCGVCAEDEVCGPNGLSGRCGVEHVFSLTETGGVPVPLAPRMLTGQITEIYALSSDELWVGSTGYFGPELLRLTGDSVEYHNPPDLSRTLQSIWASSPEDVWVVASEGVARFDGTSWIRVDPGFEEDASPNLVSGSAADDVWIAAYDADDRPLLRHYDGAGWADWPVPSLWSSIEDIHVNETERPYVVHRGSVHQWNGLSYVTFDDDTMDIERVWISPTGSVVAFDEDEFSDFVVIEVAHLEDSGPVFLHDEFHHPGCQYSSRLIDIDGTADDDIWVGTCLGSFIYDGTDFLSLRSDAPLIAPTGGGNGFLANATEIFEHVFGEDIVRFDSGEAPNCEKAVRIGDGEAWLLCDNRLARVDDRGFSYEGTTDVAAISATPTTNLWLALDDGTLVQRLDSGETEIHEDFLGSDFADISVVTDTNVWVLTTDGGVGHYDGSAWSTSIVPIASSSGKISASESEVWVSQFSSSATPYRWTGTEWEAVAIPETAGSNPTFIRDLLVDGTDVWMITDDDDRPRESRFILHQWTGSDWSDFASFPYSFSRTTLSVGPDGLTTCSRPEGQLLFESWTDSGSTHLATLNPTYYYGSRWHFLLSSDEILFDYGGALYRMIF